MKISIALCTFNGEKFLGEQLASYESQIRPPDELVVCDDVSTDNTKEILRSFAVRAPFPVRLVFNEHNLGLVKNFEKAISLCEGDVICLSDQDDVWNSDKLLLVEQSFLSADDIGMVYADADVVTENLLSTGTTMWQCINFNRRKQRKFRENEAIDCLLKDGCVLGSSMAFRRKYIDQILPIPLDIYFVHDNWIALIVAAVSRIYIIEKPLMKYRQHSNQSSSGVRPHSRANLSQAWTASKSSNTYESVIRQIDILQSRIASEQVSLYMKQKITSARQHLELRSHLPKNILRRIMQVIPEYSRGNYRSFSNGIRSAMKDIYRFS